MTNRRGFAVVGIFLAAIFVLIVGAFVHAAGKPEVPKNARIIVVDNGASVDNGAVDNTLRKRR